MKEVKQMHASTNKDLFEGTDDCVPGQQSWFWICSRNVMAMTCNPWLIAGFLKLV